jgi:LmbE family N-acetylglucosaminyl deacetylase
MRYVCVFAHPDDEMRCLGTLLRLQAAGHSFGFITVSAGDNGLPFETESVDATAVRDAEMRAVVAEFDAPYHCLGAEDGFVYDDGRLRRRMITVLRQLEADVIFTHWTSDYNPDHVETARLAVDAALLAPLGSFVPEQPAIAAAPRILHVDPGHGFGFEATHLVALTPELAARKAELMRLHRSQMAVMQQLSGADYADQLARADRVAGDRMLCYAAEGFRPCLAERRIPWPSDLPGQPAAS